MRVLKPVLNLVRNDDVLITLSEKRKSVMSVKTKQETDPTGVTKLSTHAATSVTHTCRSNDHGGVISGLTRGFQPRDADSVL